ncbi:MAG: hypothetical protein LBG72_07285 [Spirochaetaceae bacterium]|jgi:hypothetical protein|nr:hypothetical protein [Spirochaetaceae bacterium]
MKTAFKLNGKDGGGVPAAQMRIAALGIALFCAITACNGSITEIINGPKPPMLKELYFTLVDENGMIGMIPIRVLTIRDAITLEKATKDGEVIVDIEDFKVILPSSPYYKVRIHAIADNAKIEFSHNGMVVFGDINDEKNVKNIFTPEAGGHTKILVTGNNWVPRQYTITYINKDIADVDADKEGAMLSSVTVTAVQPEQVKTLRLTDGVFENGTKSNVVNLSAGTTSVTVSAEAEDGGSVTYSQNPVALTTGGVTAVYINAAKEGKSPSTYTLLFSAPAKGQNIQPSIIVVPFKTMYKTGESINSSEDLAVYLRTEDGVTEKVSGGFGGIPAAVFTAAGTREITVTYTYAQTSLSAKYTVWITDAIVIPSLQIIGGYDAGGSVELEYVDGGVLRLTRDAVSGEILTYSAERGTLAGGVIRSVKIGANPEILLGRKDSDGVITLKLNSITGALEFRDADAGYTPIGSYAEFQLISTASGGLAGKYKQEADLDLLGKTDYYGGAQNWMPIGTAGTGFTGEFDGGEHTIDNLYIDTSAQDVGLFGYVGADGTLKNIHIASGSVTGVRYTGGIAGSILGTISACYNTGAVSITGTVADSCAGGIAGNNEGTISGCYNTGAVTYGGVAYSSAGGIAGVNSDGIISACYNTGAVTGGDNTYTGGIVGAQVNGGAISACYWDNSVADAPANGIGNPAGDTNATPFGGAAAFPPVTTATHAEWGTGDGSGSGKYWKAGTTGGGQLPKLWVE